MATTEENVPTEWADDAHLDDDYFDEDLPTRPTRRKFGPVTWTMLGLAMAAGAFYAGVRVEKHNAGSSSSSSVSSLISRFRAAAGQTATRGAGTTGGLGTGGGGATTGTITLIDGSTIYVTQSDGSIVKVVTSPASQYSVTSSGTIANLHPGDNVSVTGPNDGSGDVTALSVTDTGAGGGGGGGARRASTTGGTGGGGGGGGFQPGG